MSIGNIELSNESISKLTVLFMSMFEKADFKRRVLQSAAMPANLVHQSPDLGYPEEAWFHEAVVLLQRHRLVPKALQAAVAERPTREFEVLDLARNLRIELQPMRDRTLRHLLVDLAPRFGWPLWCERRVSVVSGHVTTPSLRDDTRLFNAVEVLRQALAGQVGHRGIYCVTMQASIGQGVSRLFYHVARALQEDFLAILWVTHRDDLVPLLDQLAWEWDGMATLAALAPDVSETPVDPVAEELARRARRERLLEHLASAPRRSLLILDTDGPLAAHPGADNVLSRLKQLPLDVLQTEGTGWLPSELTLKLEDLSDVEAQGLVAGAVPRLAEANWRGASAQAALKVHRERVACLTRIVGAHPVALTLLAGMLESRGLEKTWQVAVEMGVMQHGPEHSGPNAEFAARLLQRKGQLSGPQSLALDACVEMIHSLLASAGERGASTLRVLHVLACLAPQHLIGADALHTIVRRVYPAKARTHSADQLRVALDDLRQLRAIWLEGDGLPAMHPIVQGAVRARDRSGIRLRVLRALAVLAEERLGDTIWSEGAADGGEVDRDPVWAHLHDGARAVCRLPPEEAIGLWGLVWRVARQLKRLDRLGESRRLIDGALTDHRAHSDVEAAIRLWGEHVEVETALYPSEAERAPRRVLIAKARAEVDTLLSSGRDSQTLTEEQICMLRLDFLHTCAEAQVRHTLVVDESVAQIARDLMDARAGVAPSVLLMNALITEADAWKLSARRPGHEAERQRALAVAEEACGLIEILKLTGTMGATVTLSRAAMLRDELDPNARPAALRDINTVIRILLDHKLAQTKDMARVCLNKARVLRGVPGLVDESLQAARDAQNIFLRLGLKEVHTAHLEVGQIYLERVFSALRDTKGGSKIAIVRPSLESAIAAFGDAVAVAEGGHDKQASGRAPVLYLLDLALAKTALRVLTGEEEPEVEPSSRLVDLNLAFAELDALLDALDAQPNRLPISVSSRRERISFLRGFLRPQSS